MAALTWRDVTAPNLGTALEGYKGFTETLNNALGGAQRTLAGIDEGISERVNKQIAMAALAEQDPEAYKAAIASGRFTAGVDPNRVSMATIAQLGAGVDTRLRQANNELAFKGAQRNENQAVALDVAGPAAVEYQRLRASDPVAAEAFRASRPELANASLGYRNLLNIEKGGMDFETAGLGNDRTRLGFKETELGMRRTEQQMRQDATTFGWEVKDRAQNETLQALAGDMASKGYTAADFDQYAADNNISGRDYFQLSGLIGAGMAGGGGGSGGGAGGVYQGNGVGGGGADFVFEAPQKDFAKGLSSAGLSPAVVAGFLGNAHVEGGYGGGQGDGGTAGGIVQWRNERRANFTRIIGKDPTRATPSEQARFVKWELDNPGQAGMTQAQADAIKNARSPEEAAALIDKHYERSDQKSTGQRVAMSRSAMAVLGDAVRQGTETRNMATNGDSIATNLEDARADRKTTKIDAANGLIKKFPGVARDDISDQLDLIMSAAKNEGVTLTPAAAAVIYENSGSEASWVRQINARLTGRTYMQGGSRAVDPNRVISMIRDVKTGQTSRVSTANRNIDRTKASVDVAVAAETAALAEVQRRMALARNNPRYDPKLVEKAASQYERAKQARILAAEGEDADNRAIDGTGKRAYGTGQTPEEPGFLQSIANYFRY